MISLSFLFLKKKQKVEMEMDIRWISNCSMSLEVAALGGELVIEVGEVRFSGTCRIEMTPMIPDIPPFPRVLLSFISQPKIDMSLKIGDGGKIDVLNVEPIAKALKRVCTFWYLFTCHSYVFVKCF